MTDPVTILQDRLAKAEAKVARYKKQLETAETEVSDIETALRVWDQVFNQASPESKGGDQSSTQDRQQLIVNILHVGRESGSTPADLFETFQAFSSESVNIDTFRTTIWRMKGKVYSVLDQKWVVEGANGLYWKREVDGLPTNTSKDFDDLIGVSSLKRSDASGFPPFDEEIEEEPPF